MSTVDFGLALAFFMLGLISHAQDHFCLYFEFERKDFTQGKQPFWTMDIYMNTLLTLLIQKGLHSKKIYVLIRLYIYEI